MGMDYEKLQRAITDQKVREGKAEGKVEEKRQTAKNLLKLGVSIDTISKATGLTPEEIQAL